MADGYVKSDSGQSVPCENYNSSSFVARLINDLILYQKVSIYDIPFEYRANYPSFYVTANRVSRYDNEEKRCEFVNFCFRDYDHLNSDEDKYFAGFIESLLDSNAELIAKHNIKKPSHIPFEPFA